MLLYIHSYLCIIQIHPNNKSLNVSGTFTQSDNYGYKIGSWNADRVATLCLDFSLADRVVLIDHLPALPSLWIASSLVVSLEQLGLHVLAFMVYTIFRVFFGCEYTYHLHRCSQRYSAETKMATSQDLI